MATVIDDSENFGTNCNFGSYEIAEKALNNNDIILLCNLSK